VITLLATQREIHLRFPSDVTFVDHAVEIVRTLLLHRSSQDPTALLVVARELLKNAVVHGNRNNRGLSVRLRVTYGANGPSRVDVEDQGSGFDTRTLAQPAPAPTQSEVGPRGYQIIRAYSSELRFNERGNQVSAWINSLA
jgi:anti-sigma regulatory factor (Ser/Thr protein kinase)